MPEDHGKDHPICGDCFDLLHPGEEPIINLQMNATRCEWCGNYTRTGITEQADPSDVPRHREDVKWLERAGARVQVEPEPADE